MCSVLHLRLGGGQEVHGGTAHFVPQDEREDLQPVAGAVHRHGDVAYEIQPFPDVARPFEAEGEEAERLVASRSFSMGHF